MLKVEGCASPPAPLFTLIFRPSDEAEKVPGIRMRRIFGRLISPSIRRWLAPSLRGVDQRRRSRAGHGCDTGRLRL